MAKLEGVKTLDMENGEITKIEYNGEVYEKVETPKKGDIGWIDVHDVYTRILDIDEVGDPVVADEYGGNWYAHDLTYFRKPSTPTLKVGDRVRLISKRPVLGFGGARVGDVGEVRSINGNDVVVDFPNHTYWNGVISEVGPVKAVETSEEQVEAPKVKAGDTIRMVENCPAGGYSIGDTFEVIAVDDEYLKFVDNDGDIRHVLVENDTRYELVPKKQKELFAKVNRPNNVPIPGDYVEFRDNVAEDCSGFLTVGKKYEVEGVDVFGGADITDDNGDYESAEPYETKAIYVKYTKEQAEQKAKKGDKILVVDAKSTEGEYGNGDILTASTGNSAGVFVEEFAVGLWNKEFIVLSPEQVGEATEGEVEAVEETEMGEAQAEGAPFEVGQFVVAEDNDRYKLTIPEAGALEVVEVGEFMLDEDILVKFHREFIDGNGITACAGEEYPVNSEYFRLATDEEIAEALDLYKIKEGDKVEVLAEDHHILSKGDTFMVKDVDEQGVYPTPVGYVQFARDGKPRIKIVEKASDKATIKPGDYVINGMGSLGRVDRIEGEWFYGEWLYNEDHPGSFPIGMATANAIKRLATPEEIAKYEEYKAGKEAKKCTQEIEVGDLVRVIDSPGALPEGSVFKVTDVDGYGDIRGIRENSDEYDYYYAPHHVELVAKAEDVYV